MIDLLLPLQEPYRLIESFFILCGFWFNGILAEMIYYEIRYKLGDERYDYRMNKITKEEWQKLLSTRNKGIQK